MRYGDTAGFEQDPYLLIAWRYRDYVIKSFNEDKPYDRFAKEQIAGDELYPADPEARQGPASIASAPTATCSSRWRTSTWSKSSPTWSTPPAPYSSGLTVGCARCHDHKFDPIPQRDYYRMQAIFPPAVNDRVFLEYNPARFYDIPANTRAFRLRQMGGEAAQINAKYSGDLKAKEDGRAARRHSRRFQNRRKTSARWNKRDSFSITWRRRTCRSAKSATCCRRPTTSARCHREAPAPDVHRLRAAAHGSGHHRRRPRRPEDLRRHSRQSGGPGEEVQPGFLTCWAAEMFPKPRCTRRPLRRKALAEWMASPDNPLFARVMVNRIWQFHFGSGLVKTPSDFGSRAGKPSHPEVARLAGHGIRGKGWSIKAMHKLIMMSDAYKRESNANAARSRKTRPTSCCRI